MSIPWSGPTDAELAADDAEYERDTYEARLAKDVAEAARQIKVRDLARARVAAERAGTLPPYDAGMLDEILARAPAPPPRVEGLIPTEGGTLVVAQRKTGKTTFQLNLAASLITGRDFLDRFAVRPIAGNVALLNFEVSGHQVARWADEHGIPRDRLFLVNLRGRRNPFTDPADLASLARLLRSHDTEALFLDPFGRAYPRDNQNDPGEVGSWLADLDRFARSDVGCEDLVLAAHAGWNGERTRGSTALEDWADSIITLTRDQADQSQRFVRAEGRDVHLDEDQLTFDEPTRTMRLAGTGSRKTTAKIRQLEALMPAVNGLLQASNISLSGNQIDKALKDLIKAGELDATHSNGDGARAANLLEKRGLVTSKDGSRGARLFWHLAPTSPTSPDLPQGTPGDFPTSPIGEVAQGSEPHHHLPNEGKTA